MGRGSRLRLLGGLAVGVVPGEDRSSKIRNGPLRGAILGVLGMLSCHALAGSARWGAWRLPGRRVGRAGGAPGVAGREKRSRRPRDAVVRVPWLPAGTSSRRAGPQSSVSWSRRFSRGSAGRWDALRTHVAPGGGKPRRVGAGAAAPGTAAPARMARAGLQTGFLGVAPPGY